MFLKNLATPSLKSCVRPCLMCSELEWWWQNQIIKIKGGGVQWKSHCLEIGTKTHTHFKQYKNSTKNGLAEKRRKNKWELKICRWRKIICTFISYHLGSSDLPRLLLVPSKSTWMILPGRWIFAIKVDPLN